MLTIYDASLAQILPDSLKADKQFVAIAAALDPILKRFAADTRKAMHLPRLDELTSPILDVLANQFHVDFFDSAHLTDDIKRNLIRNSIALHRLKGTVAAVEFVTNQFFRSARVIDDGLGSFLFKIETGAYTSTPEAWDVFCRMLWNVKPVRSWLVGIDMDVSPPPTLLHVGAPLLTSSVREVGLRRAKGAINRVHAGNMELTGGDVSIGLRRPKGSKVAVKVGSPLVLFRQVLIDSKDKPLLRAVRENPIADLAIASVAIARGDNFVESPLYDFLKIFFRFPGESSARRFITLRNPRDDLTRREIKRVADYAVDHELLLNKAQEQVEAAPRANLIARKVTTLI